MFYLINLKMRKALVLCVLLASFSVFAQTDKRISTLDFVQVQNDNYSETVYYYQNNWNVLREWAIEENYIHSYEFVRTKYSEEQPYHFILITTYANKAQFDKREENFEILIKRKGGSRLKNDIQPKDFRKLLNGHREAKHGFDVE